MSDEPLKNTSSPNQHLEENPDIANHKAFQWQRNLSGLFDVHLKALDIAICLILLIGLYAIGAVLDLDTFVESLPNTPQKVLGFILNIIPFVAVLIYIAFVPKRRSSQDSSAQAPE